MMFWEHYNYGIIKHWLYLFGMVEIMWTCVLCVWGHFQHSIQTLHVEVNSNNNHVCGQHPLISIKLLLINIPFLAINHNSKFIEIRRQHINTCTSYQLSGMASKGLEVIQQSDSEVLCLGWCGTMMSDYSGFCMWGEGF